MAAQPTSQPVLQDPVLPKGGGKTGIPIFGPLIDMLNGFLGGLLSRKKAPAPPVVSGTTGADNGGASPPAPASAVKTMAHPLPGVKKPHGSIKILGVVALILIVFLFALQPILTRMLSGNGAGGNVGLTPTVTVTPEPTSTPTGGGGVDEVLRDPSPYANDPEVLEFLDRLGSLDKKMDSIVFREEGLRVPLLDWKVSF
jgi:hypothetical protein